MDNQNFAAAMSSDYPVATPVGSLLTSLAELELFHSLTQEEFLRAKFREQQAAARLLHLALEGAGACALRLAGHLCVSERGFYNWDFAIRELEYRRHVRSNLRSFSLKEARDQLAHDCWATRPEWTWQRIREAWSELNAFAAGVLHLIKAHESLHAALATEGETVSVTALW